MATATVIVPSLDGARLAPLLRSLAAQTVEHQTIVIDNGSPGRSVSAACASHPGMEVLRLERNAGFGRAVNRAAQRAEGDVLVLLNDDSVCEPAFVAELVAKVDPAVGAAMATGVLRDRRDPALIETAGITLDRTMLVCDHLNGEPVSCLDGPVAEPFGPVGAAAAFDRATFAGAGGFDENLFAYWEDVDLALRLRREGARCALAPRALGTHEHSGTLGPGSRAKNYLAGFGRGYVLRKWNILGRGRIAEVLVGELGVCVAQALVDRTLSGVSGRVRGWRAATPSEPYPAMLLAASDRGAIDGLLIRARRRRRLRRGARQQRAG